MNISSLLTGIVIGAAATNMMSKNSQNGSVNQIADKAKGKMMDFATLGMNFVGDGLNDSPNHSSTHESHATSGTQTQNHSKESSLKMVKDFIKQNPDVKYEVDMILKETNTVIPGL